MGRASHEIYGLGTQAPPMSPPNHTPLSSRRKNPGVWGPQWVKFMALLGLHCQNPGEERGQLVGKCI